MNNSSLKILALSLGALSLPSNVSKYEENQYPAALLRLDQSVMPQIELSEEANSLVTLVTDISQSIDQRADALLTLTKTGQPIALELFLSFFSELTPDSELEFKCSVGIIDLAEAQLSLEQRTEYGLRLLYLSRGRAELESAASALIDNGRLQDPRVRDIILGLIVDESVTPFQRMVWTSQCLADRPISTRTKESVLTAIEKVLVDPRTLSSQLNFIIPFLERLGSTELSLRICRVILSKSDKEPELASYDQSGEISAENIVELIERLIQSDEISKTGTISELFDWLIFEGPEKLRIPLAAHLGKAFPNEIGATLERHIQSGSTTSSKVLLTLMESAAEHGANVTTCLANYCWNIAADRRIAPDLRVAALDVLAYNCSSQLAAQLSEIIGNDPDTDEALIDLRMRSGDKSVFPSALAAFSSADPNRAARWLTILGANRVSGIISLCRSGLMEGAWNDSDRLALHPIALEILISLNDEMAAELLTDLGDSAAHLLKMPINERMRSGRKLIDPAYLILSRYLIDRGDSNGYEIAGYLAQGALDKGDFNDKSSAALLKYLSHSSDPRAARSIYQALCNRGHSSVLVDLISPALFVSRLLMLTEDQKAALPGIDDYISALELCGDLGISNPYRISPPEFIKLVETRTAPTTLRSEKEVLMLIAYSDHNGALTLINQAITNYHDNGYRVWYYEVQAVHKGLLKNTSLLSTVVGAVRDYRERTDSVPLDIFHLSGHGSPYGINLYDGGGGRFSWIRSQSLTVVDLVDLKKAGLFTLFRPKKSYFVVYSCSVGGEAFFGLADNFLEGIRDQAGDSLSAGNILGPKYDTSKLELYFDQDRMLSNMSFNGGTVRF